MARLRALLVAALLVLASLSASACLFDQPRRDGAICSAQGGCPPGQRCSSAGQCLWICPEAGCVGGDCACSSLRWDESSQPPYACQRDGLCHFSCDPSMGGGCNDNMGCDPATLLCAPACGPDQPCVNGASCLSISDPMGGSLCRAPEVTDQDGGVGDGGAGDGDAGDGGNLIRCGSSLVDPSQDTAHCGRCDHPCMGGDCIDGTCRPYLLVGGGVSYSVRGLAVDGSDLFFADGLGDAIFRCPLSGCSSPTQLTAGSAGGITVLAVAPTADSVVWGAYNDGKVRRCSKSGCGGSPQNLGNYGGNGIATDDSSVFFWDQGALVRCDLPSCSGGTTTIAAAAPGAPWAIAVNGGTVFFTNLGVSDGDGTVESCHHDGCSGVHTILAEGRLAPYALVFFAGNLIWREPESIQSCFWTGCGGSPSVVAGYPSEGATGDMNRLAAANHGIYWDHYGELLYCPDATCSGGYQNLQLGPTPGTAGSAVIADDTSVIFAGSDGKIYRLAPP